MTKYYGLRYVEYVEETCAQPKVEVSGDCSFVMNLPDGSCVEVPQWLMAMAQTGDVISCDQSPGQPLRWCINGVEQTHAG